MERIDLRGLSCPQPVIELKKAIDAGQNEIEIIVDCGAAQENTKRLAQSHGYVITAQESEDGSIVIRIKR